MKTFFNKSENWLLIAPIVLSFILFISIGYKDVDLHFADTYFIIGNPVLTFLIISLLFLSIPFAMHLLLRRFKARNTFISKLHVVITILILSSFYLLVTQLQKPPKFLGNSSSFRITAEQLLTLVVLLQIVFILYSTIVLITSSIKYRRTSVLPRRERS